MDEKTERRIAELTDLQLRELLSLVRRSLEGYSFILLPGCFPKVTLVTGLEKFIHISTAQDEHFLRMAIRPGHGNGSSI